MKETERTARSSETSRVKAPFKSVTVALLVPFCVTEAPGNPSPVASCTVPDTRIWATNAKGKRKPAKKISDLFISI
ncbi:MAG: hypothetical protein BWY72_00204 [Bacteroidetes bacterium ADurb.Bin416]|nr:MAG: hypothetical protein BWY72_00204 [Bacteroidetes bacterium ADurb.Bin416]